MRKILKIANAELSKIFMRPSMFVLFGVLIVALVLSFMFFKPAEVNTKFEYNDGFTTRIYTNFQNDYIGFESKLINAKLEIDDYLDDENNTCDIFKKYFRDLDYIFSDELSGILLSLSSNSVKKNNTMYPNDEDLAQIQDCFENFKSTVRTTKIFMLENIKDKYTNLFITNDDYEYIYKTLNSIYDIVPSSEQLGEYSVNSILERYNLIKDSFNIKGLNKKVNSFEKIVVDNEKLELLLQKYYYTNIEETNNGEIEYVHKGKLEDLYYDIHNYYYEVGESSDNNILAILNDKVSKFYDYITICTKLITNNFEILRIGKKSDDEIASYNGFSGVSSYSLKNEAVTYEYFYENDVYGYEYLRSFNFNVNSGTTTNCFDFTFYALQILSSLITIFVIFFACGSLSGEQTAGTLKMVATRPYTRNKIYSGKSLACFNVALLLLLLSFVASFAVGIAMFGFTAKQVLVVVNASNVILISPFLVMLIYFGSLLLNIVFYISLALIISMLIKQTVISTSITSAVFIISTVIQGISNSSSLRFVPSLNLGIFKFFTQSKLGIFSYNVIPNITMSYCLIMIAVSVLVFDILGRLLFTHRSIDK